MRNTTKKVVLEGLVCHRRAWYKRFQSYQESLSLGELFRIEQGREIPTQYSIHFCQQLGQISEHRDFLSDGKVDPREELARHLIDNLEGAKSIVVYSNFERKIIQSLAEYLPNRKEVFDKIIDKFVDLEDIIRKHFYHPGFRGSSSIKRVLPALVPSMSYEHLSIADGNSAMGAFVEICLCVGVLKAPINSSVDEYKAQNIVKGKTSHQRRNELRSALLEYCKRDTQAMVECHRKLSTMCKRRSKCSISKNLTK